MPTYQPVDFDPFAGQSDGQIRVRVSTAPQYKPVDHDPFSGVGMAEDVAKSAGIGAVKGGIGTVGAGGDVRDLLSQGVDYAAQYFGVPADKVEQFKNIFGEVAKRTATGQALANAPTSGDIQKKIEGVTGEFYKPKTLAGEYAQTAGEFLPAAVGGPGGAVARTARVLVPALTSETAGQATKGTAAEPVARFLGALAGGGVQALASRPGSAARSIANQLPEGITEPMVIQADRLMQEAAQRGIQLAWPEALSQVAGRPVLTNMMRHLEASPQTEGQMGAFFGGRPQAVEGAVRQEMGNIAPPNYVPSQVGPTVGATAGQIVRESPEGQILADTLWRAGPRVTPEGAGNVIQQELGNVYGRREGMRAALADQDYTAARNAPATIPTNGGHRLADVTTHYLDRPDIPIIVDPAERAAAQSRWFDQNNPTNRTPIIGERPTQFAQVDAGPVLDHVNSALDSAKGAVRQGLQAAKNALLRPDGSIDTSVAGLHNSRVAIDDLISQAKLAGANHTVTELQAAKTVLDQVLESVPSYGNARKSFQAASQPLSAFDEARVPGQIVKRDQFNERFVMPPERVPSTIQNNGPSGARDFNSVATPSAREAFEQHIVTQVLDQASKNGADISADAIRKALVQNEDILRQYPGVRDRLQSIAIARDGLERVEQSPIGKLASRDTTTKQAVDALFPRNPLPNSQQEVSEAVSALSSRNPRVARDLVRTHAESTFNEAARDLQTGPNQANGAKFVVAIAGNAQQRANLQAAVEALPNGAQRWDGFNRLLEVLEATGTRQGIGSRTAYNVEINKAQGAGGLVRDAGKIGANPTRLLQPLADKYDQWKLGRNLGQLATILTDPNSANMLRAIARAPRDGRRSTDLAIRLVTYGEASRPTENRGQQNGRQ